MPQLKVLICGAGIAGNALAYWLAKKGHDVTVLERWPSLRVSGLQLDLRGHGIDVMRRMGLEAAVRAHCVDEEGLELLDREGRAWAFFPANKTGKGPQSFSSEFEIMRGDLCRVMHDAAVAHGAKYKFGTTVVACEELSGGGGEGEVGVEVTFEDGSRAAYDLLVGADGQGSRTRRMMLGVERDDSVERLGTCIAYCTIPRGEQPGERWRGRATFMSGSDFFLTRRHNPRQLQVYLASSVSRIGSVRRGDVEAEKEAFVRHFRSQLERLDDVLGDVQESDDFYCEHLGIVRLPSWHKGSVVLIGDAAHCTPANGHGVTSGMVGAYILAGEIERHCGRAGTRSELPTALKAYEDKHMPFMSQVQKGISSKKGWLETFWDGFMDCRAGVAFVYYLAWIVCMLRLDYLLGGMDPITIKKWDFPEYPELLAGDEAEK